MHTPKAIFALSLENVGSSAESVGNFDQGWGFIVLINKCLVELLEVKANAEGAIWFPFQFVWSQGQ